jgi:hypothetical protein
VTIKPEHIRNILILNIIALILAIFSWPYHYYIILRFCTSITCVLCLTQIEYTQRKTFFISLVASLVIYNPIVMFHFSKTIWTGLNLITAFQFYHAYKTINKQ